MLNLLDPHGLRLCDGVSRRSWLQVGSLALGGLTLPRLLAAQEKATTPAISPSTSATRQNVSGSAISAANGSANAACSGATQPAGAMSR